MSVHKGLIGSECILTFWVMVSMFSDLLRLFNSNLGFGGMITNCVDLFLVCVWRFYSVIDGHIHTLGLRRVTVWLFTSDKGAYIQCFSN